ncbi:MAG: 3-oxoacyl-ACP reductase FabG [Clostridiales bacterium]|nr:3-oxoacyl-ACP reductase FabG [Clostridiales bacterium]
MDKRVALVTGSSRGIGRATAIALSAQGYNVIINCINNESLAKETADIICETGGRADYFMADVGDAQAVRALYEFARKTFGFVDTVVNNAGISRYALFTDEDAESYDSVMNTNLRGVFNVCRVFVPDMIENKFGRIINISSMWGLVGASCECLYSASKAAVLGLTTSLAKELGPSNITVNAVAPGVIKTDMIKNISLETIKGLAEDTPIGRCGEPQDVANAVCFLASKQSSFITGEVINCSGGYIIK